MIISELLEGLSIKKMFGPMNSLIKGIAYDSRLVKKDFLFVAVKGFSVDGHDYITDALSRGAAALIVENAAARANAKRFDTDKNTAFVEVSDSRKALALISAAFYGHPSGSLSLIGITGTNGKTTTSFIVKNIIEAGGKKTGLLGTNCYMTGGKTRTAPNTTPESLDLQRYLSEMVDNKMEYAAIEVSSHGLALKRVEGSSFKVAAFTNFTQDHLDFHGSMDEYFKAKGMLFSYMDGEGTAVLNWDDPKVKTLANDLKCKVVTCGTEDGAMIRAENIKGQSGGAPGLYFDIQTPHGRFNIESQLMGRFNVSNILMAAGITHALGFSADVIQKGIRNARPVEGRFENINAGQSFTCIVDYAHTDDALKKLLEEARRIAEGKMITVFGCGGDRDKTKRPLMGVAASELSDFVFVTSDNPRSEDPSGIIEEIIMGMKKKNYKVQTDRRDAIKEAVAMAHSGDILIVAGKGHEEYQEIDGVRNHFSDKEELRKAIKKQLGS